MLHRYLTIQFFFQNFTCLVVLLVLTVTTANSAVCKKEADLLVDCVLTYYPHEFDPEFVDQLTDITYQQNDHYFLKRNLKINVSDWFTHGGGWIGSILIKPDKPGKSNVKAQQNIVELNLREDMKVESDLLEFCKDESVGALRCEIVK
ncbi:MAG: hypothetical protein D3910_24985 [Candidatus Electrothrix sp. ATG2]|nr:hypothetical protein [Candidatus Electrothrix sp. ATG2]